MSIESRMARAAMAAAVCGSVRRSAGADIVFAAPRRGDVARPSVIVLSGMFAPRTRGDIEGRMR